jgi:hypothetical protein
MSPVERVKRWFPTLGAALEAAEEDPFVHLDRQISSLNDRVRNLENERPNGAGAAFPFNS